MLVQRLSRLPNIESTSLLLHELDLFCHFLFSSPLEAAKHEVFVKIVIFYINKNNEFMFCFMQGVEIKIAIIRHKKYRWSLDSYSDLNI